MIRHITTYVRPRVEICGGIASGKTTLARAILHYIAHLRAHLVLESYRNNPYWETFYKEHRFRFEKDVSFILQHATAIKRAASHSTLICDFALFQDLAYAEKAYEPNVMGVIESLYEILTADLSAPSAIIYLKCAADVLQKRILLRGRAQETLISLDYLRILNQNIEQRLQSLPPIPVITLNSEINDFRELDQQRRAAAELVQRV